MPVQAPEGSREDAAKGGRHHPDHKGRSRRASYQLRKGARQAGTVAAPPWGLSTRGPGETAAFGRLLGATAPPGAAALLAGPVGAGKTVLAGGLLEGLGVAGPHPSPTFPLVRAYQGRLGAAHLDLYRVEPAPAAALDPDPWGIGLAELLDGGAVVVVEWPDRLGPWAPSDALRIRLSGPGGEERRELRLVAGGPVARAWLGGARRAARERGLWP
jgi:tRNA threonylcarbamoyladenosine biosynthesis protein TsaE